MSVIEEEGYDQVTVTQLCQRAGISRSTFYRRFGTLDAAFDCMVTGFVEDFHRKCLIRAAAQQGGLRSCEAYREFFGYWLERRELVKALMRSGIYASFSSCYWRALRRHIAILNEDISDVENTYLSACISSTLMTLLSTWADRDFAEPVEAMVGLCAKTHHMGSLTYAVDVSTWP